MKRSALLPTLHLIQEQEGYITSAGIEYAASLLDLTPAQVHDTASYYTMYRFAPEGKVHVEFCTNLSCALAGADELLAETCRRLGIREGGTTPDGRFTVRRVECLAACGGAPAVQVDGEWVENAKEDDLDRDPRRVADLPPLRRGRRARARRSSWPTSGRRTPPPSRSTRSPAATRS